MPPHPQAPPPPPQGQHYPGPPPQGAYIPGRPPPGFRGPQPGPPQGLPASKRIKVEEEEEDEPGVPREVAAQRFVRWTEWMEEILSSGYNIRTPPQYSHFFDPNVPFWWGSINLAKETSCHSPALLRV